MQIRHVSYEFDAPFPKENLSTKPIIFYEVIHEKIIQNLNMNS